jgi:major intracellular serine protease
LNDRKARLIPFKVQSVEQKADTLPYGIETIEAPYLWDKGIKGEGIVVAILDTGIDLTHPDLKDNIIGGKNFTDEGSEDDFHDENGHGTHVAGTIGATVNGSGVIGVAPNCKLLIIKVLGKDGGGSYSGIIDGIKYATNWQGENSEKVRIMSMSLGGSDDVPELHEAIRDAVRRDIAVVVASGNEGDNNENTFEFGYPALYNECIEVAASDEKNKLAKFSNNNLQVDVIAPGVNVLSTYMGGEFAKLSGTSMATPHVTGALALLLCQGEQYFQRRLTESEMYALLVKHTVSLGLKPSSEGHGLVRLGYTSKIRTLSNFISKTFN